MRFGFKNLDYNEQEYDALILYYQRRYTKADPAGDCVRCPAWGVKEGYVESSPKIDECTYYYSDLKMCDVKTRKEAFAEINLFMEANELHTNNTAIFKDNENNTYISLWESHNCSGLATIVCFVLSDCERPSNGYRVYYYDGFSDSGKPQYDDIVFKQAECPDMCYRRYVEAKKNQQGGG